MAPSRRVRWTEILALAAVGLTLLVGVVPLQRALAPAHHAFHPWWEIPGLIVGALFLLAAIVLVFPIAWQWDPIKKRIPFDFQSPIVRRNPIPRISAPPVAPGRLDFELYQKKASEASVKLLGKMSKEMGKNTTKVTRRARKIQSVANAAIERRHHAAIVAARVFRRHARRLSRIEARYRIESGAFLTNSRRMIEAGMSDEVFVAVVTSTAELRNGAVGSRTGTSGYRDAAQGTRDLNLSQALNGASDDLVAVLGRVMEDSEAVIAYCDWVAETAAN